MPGTPLQFHFMQPYQAPLEGDPMEVGWPPAQQDMAAAPMELVEPDEAPHEAPMDVVVPIEVLPALPPLLPPVPLPFQNAQHGQYAQLRRQELAAQAKQQKEHEKRIKQQRAEQARQLVAQFEAQMARQIEQERALAKQQAQERQEQEAKAEQERKMRAEQEAKAEQERQIKEQEEARQLEQQRKAAQAKVQEAQHKRRLQRQERQNQFYTHLQNCAQLYLKNRSFVNPTSVPPRSISQQARQRALDENTTPQQKRAVWQVSEQEWQQAIAYFKNNPNEMKLAKKNNPRLSCSFIKTEEGQIYAIMPGLRDAYGKKTTLGEGGYGKVKLCQKRNGERFAIKVEGEEDMVKARQDSVEKQVLRTLGEMKGQSVRYNPKGWFDASKQRRYASVKRYTVTNLYAIDLHKVILSLPVHKEKQKQALALKAALAVKVMHDLNIIHGDLKPPNFMLNHQGDVKAIDFGLAKKLKAGESFVYDFPMYTLKYMEPTLRHAYNRFQYDDNVRFPFTKATDVYALAIMLRDDLRLPMPQAFWSQALDPDPNQRLTIDQVIDALRKQYQPKAGLRY